MDIDMEEQQTPPPDKSIDYLFSIWPIAASLASHTPAGDLISLSRTSRRLRQVTHNESSLKIALGNDSQYWSSLKHLSPFICSQPGHKDPKLPPKVSPCKFCSRPICKACIVREFFQNPNPKYTFRSRARFLCQKCWTTGNLRKDFRVQSATREHIWHGRHYAQRGGTCSCSASEDNWLCGPCRNWQTSGFTNNHSLLEAEQASHSQQDSSGMKCYGLDCEEPIIEEDRDRRRICLWCSKALPRQYGGEERLRWEDKQISIRAAHAAARSADIYEWARNRFRTLTMSRREMRGTEACIALTGSDGTEHDQPMFVRHLDAVNYRRWMGNTSAPTGQQVYDSKQGRWTYSKGFLKRANLDILRDRNNPAMFMLDEQRLKQETSQGGLKRARTNGQMAREAHTLDVDSTGRKIFRWSAHLMEAGLMEERDLETYGRIDPECLDLRAIRDMLWEQLERWYDLDDEERDSWSPITMSILIEQFTIERSGHSEDMKTAAREPPPDFEDIDNHLVVDGGLPDSRSAPEPSQTPTPPATQPRAQQDPFMWDGSDSSSDEEEAELKTHQQSTSSGKTQN